MLSLGKNEFQAIRRRIQLAEEYNRKELKEKFKRSLELYTGEHYRDSQQPSERARVVVNYVLNAVETKVNSVAFRYPEFTIKAGTQEALGQEDLAKAALRYAWKQGKIQDELKRGWKDKELYGVGIVYCGWLFSTYDGKRLENGREPTDADQLQPDTTPNPTDTWYSEPAAVVRDDRFLVKRINPGSFFVSPEAGTDIESADYCGYIEVRSLDEVQANPYYKNTRQLKGTTYNLQPWFDEQMCKAYVETVPDEGEKVPSDIKRVKLYHYYEKARRVHVVTTDEHDKPLLVEEWTWQHDRYPFRVRQNPGDTDKFWKIPSPLMIEHQQKELNEARSQLSDHRRRFVPKFQTQTGILNANARKALKSADSGEVVEYTGSDPAPIAPIQMPQLQPEVYSTEQQVNTDIQTILGMNAYELGRAPTKRTPTAEVQAIQSQGSSRAQNDQQEFESWCAEVAEDCLAWMKMYSVKTRSLPIYDNQGNIQAWRDFSGDEIRGEYDICVYVGSTTPPNDQTRLEQIGFLLQSLNPLFQLAPVAQQMGINLIPLARQILASLPEIKDVNEIFMQAAPGGMPLPAGPMGMPMSPEMGAGTDPGLSAAGQGVPFAPVDERKSVDPQLIQALMGAGGGY